VRHVAAAFVALALAACSSAPPPQHGHKPEVLAANPPVDVWIVSFLIQHGTPRLGGAHTSNGDHRSVAPCAPASYVRDAHRATMPEKPATSWDRLHTRDVVVETLDARGRVLCSRLLAVPVETAIEVPPPAAGGQFGPWLIAPAASFYFEMSIPRDEPFAALRVSGWRGVQAKTFTAGELRQRAQ
jgi:hypothetical protein